MVCFEYQVSVLLVVRDLRLVTKVLIAVWMWVLLSRSLLMTPLVRIIVILLTRWASREAVRVCLVANRVLVRVAMAVVVVWVLPWVLLMTEE